MCSNHLKQHEITHSGEINHKCNFVAEHLFQTTVLRNIKNNTSQKLLFNNEISVWGISIVKPWGKSFNLDCNFRRHENLGHSSDGYLTLHADLEPGLRMLMKIYAS